jgi:hypothetical protein
MDSVTQTVEFSDSEAPSLIGEAPAAETVQCGAYPGAMKLSFADNCQGDMSVSSVDTELGGSVCQGRKYIRSWEAPSDTCGNKGSDITQEIIVLDQEDPAFVSACEEVVLECPRDFDVNSLPIPQATDDCMANVAITNSVPAFDMCSSGFSMEWTATDNCGKTDKAAQKITFTNTKMPTFSCPSEDIVPSGGGVLSHVLDLGNCFSESDVSISVVPTCEECDCVGGGSCSEFDYDMVGSDLHINTVPNKAKISWTATMDYGCGSETITCSAKVAMGGETMFGKPWNEKENSILDLDSSRWGWYQTTAKGPGKHTFDMWAGAADNDLTKGTFVGTVEVTVEDCASGKESTADWSGIPGDSGLCVVHEDEDHHLHVGKDYPRTNQGAITVGPGSFTPGCCSPGETCYIFVHGVVAEMTCGDDGCI